MTEKRWSKLRIITLIVFIWLISISLCLFIRVEPLIKWSSETYMGIFVAFIGIAAALIIGYQVISTSDVKSDLRSMRSDLDIHLSKWRASLEALESKHDDLSNNLDSMNASVREGIAVLDALRISGESGNIGSELRAFCKMHEALLYSLDYNSTNCEFILTKLREFGSRICTHSFGAGFAMNKNGFYYATPDSPYYNRKLTDIVYEIILPPIRQIEEQIKSHKNFTSISFSYSDLMSRFYNRVEMATSRFFPTNWEEFDKF
ncbi:MAG: hypothetical protein NC453_17185 [Muribaculum sp.]|nr:hypothetical protein [Muribaculum sp.]